MSRDNSLVSCLLPVLLASLFILMPIDAVANTPQATETNNCVANEELRVASHGFDGVSPELMLYQYLMERIKKSLDANAEAYEKLKTPEEIADYQRRMRHFFVERVGGFPERTPLRARVVDRLERDGYTVEKIMYESRPRFYVTALLYLPKEETCGIKPPYPGVLVPCGHWDSGKAKDVFQRVSAMLARNGCVALCYDPIGQGERFQLLDDHNQPLVRNVFAHNAANVSSMLIGSNLAAYRIWDGIRGIDYLQSRPEVDAERIGCTGNSGGGTLTSYIMSLDDRVDCAAPSCYLTSFRRMLATIGPQDAEQNIFGQIAFGMDHAEYMIMRAPRPTLMCTATRDFMDIDGSWDSFRLAKRIYTRLGFAERVDLIETDEKHGFTTLLRVGAVRWMRRWLLHVDDAIEEPDLPVLSEAEAKISPQGQVVLIDGARTTYDIDADQETKLAAQRAKIWQGDKNAALAAVRKTTGIREPAQLPKLECEKVGRIQRDGYHIDKLVLKLEPELWLTALAFVPENAEIKDACLYINAAGKEADAAVGGPIEALVQKGQLVLALDPRGVGVSNGQSPTYTKNMGPLWTECTLAYLLGTSLVAMQAEDIMTAAMFLANYESPSASRAVHVIAKGRPAVAALHAVALAPECFASLKLVRCLDSWADVVRTPLAKQPYPTLVFAALKTYDLPDLRASLPADKLHVVEPLDANGKVITKQ